MKHLFGFSLRCASRSLPSNADLVFRGRRAARNSVTTGRLPIPNGAPDAGRPCRMPERTGNSTWFSLWKTPKQSQSRKCADGMHPLAAATVVKEDCGVSIRAKPTGRPCRSRTNRRAGRDAAAEDCTSTSRARASRSRTPFPKLRPARTLSARNPRRRRASDCDVELRHSRGSHS
eukprot:8749146-Pyramimonas_sp.AAC.1